MNISNTMRNIGIGLLGAILIGFMWFSSKRFVPLYHDDVLSKSDLLELSQSAEKGDLEVILKLKSHYESINNTQEWSRLVYQAALLGDQKSITDAFYYSFEVKLDGFLAIPENKKKIREKLISLAGSGNPEAEYYLGRAYLYGYGLDANRNQAIEWLRKAAKRESVSAIAELVPVLGASSSKAELEEAVLLTALGERLTAANSAYQAQFLKQRAELQAKLAASPKE